MFRALLACLFLPKSVSTFNPEQVYCQAQRFLQYQARQVQQAEQAPAPRTPAARPPVPKAARKLVAC